ncbi:MAG: tRNA (adenosine(37)-N6)-threonylcarbamoyltransferase complex dimerization subunit type 1 TsaB, partial [Phycisphaerales bacterium]|nr:tRNA (adenosine(37)-N6)-threonylcarbamoyltransferase complex dimerization subunit type 1 TsaB [Phycisphaerales bacterium]
LGRGSKVLEAARFSKARAHAAEFLPTIDALCRAHDVEPQRIEWVFVSAGPGSFTGLRIGITAARMIAMAVGARIVAIPTLEVIAQNALDSPNPPDQVAVILDAKRKRVYSATFARQFLPPYKEEVRGDRYVALNEPREADPIEYFAKQDRSCAVLGEGVLYHRDAVAESGLAILPESMFPPRAETVYHLGVERAAQGNAVAARDLIPIYIRPPEAEEVWQARHRAQSP